MRYVCSVCGYVYDEEKEKRAFSQLPESWVCPLCGAAKSLFVPEKSETAEMKKAPAAAPVRLDEDLERLPVGVLAALCSNLARGCEKQYKEKEAGLFKELAGHFTAAVPAEEGADRDVLDRLFAEDLETGYPAVSGAAKEAGDRGTLRVCVWGEKVTAILHSLMQRYEREGEAFLKDTEIWVCSVCGFVYVGDEPPAICPVCKVPAWKFERTEGRRMA